MFGLTKSNRLRQSKHMSLRIVRFFIMLKYGITMGKLFLFLH